MSHGIKFLLSVFADKLCHRIVC